MANLFVWGKAVEEAVHKMREHAEKPENWYRPGITQTLPGDNAFLHVWSGTTKAVFSWTVVGRSWNPRHPPAGTVIRHLTVSVQGGKYPRPDVCWTLAHHLGFTGATPGENGLCRDPSPTWVLGQDDDEGCAVIQQIVLGVSGVLPPAAVH